MILLKTKRKVFKGNYPGNADKMTERKRFTLMFPLVFTFFGGGLFFVGLFMTILLVILGDETGTFLEFGIISVVVGLFLVYVAYRALGSFLPLALISFGNGLFLMGLIILLVALVIGDAPSLIPLIGAVFLLVGLFLAYFGYRKLVRKLMERENRS